MLAGNAKEKLTEAVEEATRFLEKANDALSEIEACHGSVYWGPSRRFASAKRASMDLTRALAELRKGV